VVLPAITWQGLNPVDDDLDGFADTLTTSRSLPLDRAFANGRLPRSLAREAEPLLRFLDRRRLPYDLTTDVALDPAAIRRAPAIVLAGSARWLPRRTLDALRGRVENGARLASFGADAFRRSVELRGDRLVSPTAPERENAFGERTRTVRIPRVPFEVDSDQIDVFGGGFAVGDFSLVDVSAGVARRAEEVVRAGPAGGRTAFIAYRLGKGLVIRAGTPQWPGELGDPAVAGATVRIWAVLRSG
jgi:hypothetical protein